MIWLNGAGGDKPDINSAWKKFKKIAGLQGKF